MIRLSRFLEVPFDSKEISLAELLAFATDHLQRMISNNPGGELTPRIAATQSALDLVVDCVTDDQVKYGLRRARKRAKNNFRAELPGQVAQLLAAVVVRYGAGAAEVLECAPQGRGVFGKCPDDALASHLQTLVSGLTAHAADLGAPLVAEATALAAGWATLYHASEAATGSKTTTQEGKRAARDGLQLALFRNLLKLADLFPREPEKLALYMQQSLLEDHPREEEEEPAAE